MILGFYGLPTPAGERQRGFNEGLPLVTKSRVLSFVSLTQSRLGWFTAYLANVFLTKLQDPISP